jgi:pyruvate-formate lyase-activating enzyme
VDSDCFTASLVKSTDRRSVSSFCVSGGEVVHVLPFAVVIVKLLHETEGSVFL